MSAKKQMPLQDRLTQITTWLEDKKGRDIVALDVQGYSSVTEGIIIATAQSTRHAKSLASWVLEQGKKHGVPALGSEGMETGEWVLIDCNDVVVHIFKEAVRQLYQIEALYADIAPTSHSKGETHG